VVDVAGDGEESSPPQAANKSTTPTIQLTREPVGGLEPPTGREYPFLVYWKNSL
jgi:hypothetical protein